MSDTTTHLGLPYLLAAQAQKHVTHNEALRLLDAMVQLSVLDRTRTAPPASPADSNRHLVASAATGLWAGWDLNIAFWIDGAWIRLVPRTGWLVWVAAEGIFLVWTGSAWEVVGEPRDVSDAVFSLVNDAEPPDGPKALDRAMQRAAQRKVEDAGRKRRKPKAAPAPAAKPITDLPAFYADLVNSDRYLPVSAISNTMRDAMLARGLVTAERLRERGVR